MKTKISARDSEVIRLRTEQLLSQKEVGKKIGMSQALVSKILSDHNVESFNVAVLRGKKRKAAILSYPELTNEELSKKLGLCRDHVSELRKGTIYNSIKFETLEDKFWRRFEVAGKDDCWEWQGTKDPHGYGSISKNNRTFYAHRISYEINVGEIPEGIFVLHSCDNPSCVNPKHLFLGTQADNVADRDKKGRQVRGERVKGSKLTEKKVIRMRDLRKKHGKDMPYRVIGKKFNVSQQSAHDAVNGHSWHHIPLDRTLTN